MSLHEYLTKKHPFGPFDQTQIYDEHDAANILDLDDPLFTAISEGYSLIYGRKGSGKSAIITGYQRYSQFQDYVEVRGSLAPRKPGETYIVSIVKWEQFYEMVEWVSRAAQSQTGISLTSYDGEAIPPEKIAQLWVERIWHEIFKSFYEAYRNNRRYCSRSNLRRVVKYFDDKQLSMLRGDAVSAARKLTDAAARNVEELLEKHNSRCFVLFDSMERYPVTNHTFLMVLSGFLKAIAIFEAKHQHVGIRFALPEEIFHFFEDASDNILKDFDDAHAVRWRPRDLLRMAAHRYRLFLQLHDPATFAEVEGLDLRSSLGLKNFYRLLFPETVDNELGRREPTIAYIMRHTNLLPRHLIVLLNHISVLSRRKTGSYRTIAAEAVVEGVAKKEVFLAKEALAPFEFTHQGIVRGLSKCMCDLPPIFSYGDLRRVVRRVCKSFDLDSDQFIALLFRVGVIGKLCPDDSDGVFDRGLYTYAEYFFNARSMAAFPTEGQYCFHPLFSKYFSAASRRNGDTRVIYPHRVAIDF